MAHTIIDTADLVREMIQDIENSQPNPPFIFVDLEGTDLSRHGSIAIMQVLVPPMRKVHLVDVYTLKELAFQTPSFSGLTLKEILESPRFPKVFFDIRNDSDALYSLFQIDVSSIIDLQLVEFAARPRGGQFLKGLAKCITESAGLTRRESNNWNQVKAAGRKLFAPELGGRYEVFDERPLPQALIDYCVQDILYMPQLLLKYARRMDDHEVSQVHLETIARISLSRSPGFNGKGRHMAVAPRFRNAPLSFLPFPASVLRSTDLAKYCTFDNVFISRASASNQEDLRPEQLQQTMEMGKHWALGEANTNNASPSKPENNSPAQSSQQPKETDTKARWDLSNLVEVIDALIDDAELDAAFGRYWRT